MSGQQWGPEDVIPHHPDDQIVRLRHDPLTGDLGDMEDLPTASHADPLRIGDALRRADGSAFTDPTPRVPWRSRGEAAVRSHRLAVHYPWWRRVCWPLLIIRVCGVLAVVLGGLIAFTGWQQQRAFDAVVRDAAVLDLVPVYQPGPTLAVMSAVTGLVMALGGLLLLFMSGLAADVRRRR